MKSLLALEHRELLAQVAFARVLLAFDFDGTLAPIVERPEDARMRSESVELFAKLCALYPCAVISGRTRTEVQTRLGEAAVKYVVGNHGLDPEVLTSDYERQVGEAKQALHKTIGATPGIEIEDKRYSLGLHYRRARQKRSAREAIVDAIGLLPFPMRIVPGKLVFNLVPAQAPSKGDALLDLRALEGADLALYVGDDVSDEDVFRLDQPGRLLSVRIGESQVSQATYFLKNQRAIDGLMKHLIRFRSKS